VSEVLDRQLEIVNTHGALNYDRPVGITTGLRWSDLEIWWAEIRGVDRNTAKIALWRHLRKSIPDSSPPQRRLFEQYHQWTQARNLAGSFPALLPEVWVHWDHKSKPARGELAMASMRMDFLMLPAGARRIILEVDGDHHYSTDGRASTALYAETMRADRDLRLDRYEVFRFGGAELTADRAEGTAFEFFDRLGISP
jgi:hypothetical protein